MTTRQQELRPAPTGSTSLTSDSDSDPGVDAVRAAAEEFVEQFHAENPHAGPAWPRITRVLREIDLTGSYRHTPAELAFGARLAWRNNARCIGRLYWRSLQVRDLRSVSHAAGIAAQCVEHLRIAEHGGRIRPVISVFAPDTPLRPGPRIWNEQLIRYAGYEQPDGSILGDPRYVSFTSALVDRGWHPPSTRGAFDVLPLVVDTVDQGPRLFPLPADAVREVPLSHPDFAWFAELGLRWHAVPVISNTRLVIGGVSYPAAPFNGWYMGTEIGARNLGDADRYDLVPTVAERMGLDTSDEATLWRDRALVELNRAVLHSFAAHGVSITDHHTESRRFITHLEREERAGRACPTDWSWIVPPLSGSQTPVFHRYYTAEHQAPNFVTDDDAVRRALHGDPPAFGVCAS
ncbi:MAG TPA: nitric oxide synthase oxygenase [Nocardioides sp.]|uniref:nitric oxide synthase oxygenase n=1 Tax=uncultured Nocardioides sp. TaxID=198441 RepID=UPI000EE362A2|nr:nitric oxide synthase oxygenase [uncultured Nocardioides sp.]HCB07141.1 nitric oxide synthase oxygenase [Nocardioides sp.]HRD59312.1 nitric oxide synthase oxygenase [Nocardioides sp.]HRI94980.1 nitric oxide synthase oxygenase [Nocardioides sp.]HRK45065.1 nitric oxide synthase oxygenase [Nocardioides sp.]